MPFQPISCNTFVFTFIFTQRTLIIRIINTINKNISRTRLDNYIRQETIKL